MLSYPKPRNYYLVVHDALRKLLGPEAELTAFVRDKKPFQCDMLVNAARTDVTRAENRAAVVSTIASDLQCCLGMCDVRAFEQRIDITFRDREVLQLALGAPRQRLNNLSSPADINAEPDWRERPRLRIALGYDEHLFAATCDLKVNLAARAMERWVYDYYRVSPRLHSCPELAAAYVASDKDWRAVAPPVVYWQAHGYALSSAYPCRHHQDVLGTVMQNFAKYYGEYPFDNPFCPGEDLNTMSAVRWVCEAWKQMAFSSSDAADAVDLVLSTPPMPDEEGRPSS